MRLNASVLVPMVNAAPEAAARVRNRRRFEPRTFAVSPKWISSASARKVRMTSRC